MVQIFFSLFLSLFCVTGVLTQLAIAQTEQRVEITNDTKSLQVEDTRVFGGITMISLKNAGSKTIIAYEMIHEDTNQWMIKQPRGFDHQLKPGESDSFKGVMNSSQRQVDTNLVKMRLAALLFSDETSEGDPESVDRLRQYHRGRKLAMKELLPFVEKLAAEFESRRTITINRDDFLSQFRSPVKIPEGVVDPEHYGYDYTITNTYLAINNANTVGNPELIQKTLKYLKQSFEKER